MNNRISKQPYDPLEKAVDLSTLHKYRNIQKGMIFTIPTPVAMAEFSTDPEKKVGRRTTQDRENDLSQRDKSMDFPEKQVLRDMDKVTLHDDHISCASQFQMEENERVFNALMQAGKNSYGR